MFFWFYIFLEVLYCYIWRSSHLFQFLLTEFQRKIPSVSPNIIHVRNSGPFSVLSNWYSCAIVLFPLESLFGGSSRGAHIPLTEGWSFSIWDGHPIWLSTQLWEGHIWSGDRGRGHLPSLPYQPNQLWWSVGWEMFQSDLPHILLFPPGGGILKITHLLSSLQSPAWCSQPPLCFPQACTDCSYLCTFSQFCRSGLASCMFLLAVCQGFLLLPSGTCSDCWTQGEPRLWSAGDVYTSWEDPWVRHPQWLLGGLPDGADCSVGPMSLRGSSGPLTSVLQATSHSPIMQHTSVFWVEWGRIGSLCQCPTKLGNWVLTPILTSHLMRETIG